MYLNTTSTADLRNSAADAIKHSKKLFNALGKEACSSAHKLSRQVVKAYPEVSDNLRHIAAIRASQLRNVLNTTGKEFYITSCKFKSGLLKVGIVYVVARLFCSKEVAVVTDKVKAHVRAKPIESSVIALGVGYLLAKALR